MRWGLRRMTGLNRKLSDSEASIDGADDHPSACAETVFPACVMEGREKISTKSNLPVLYAHSTELADKATWQTLADHSNNVSAISGRFASAFGARGLGELLGLVHDAGKASRLFQQRLEGRPIEVDHSTAGGKMLVDLFDGMGADGKARGRWGACLAYAVLGHHGGLPNGRCGEKKSSLFERLNGDIEPFASFADTVALPEATGLKNERLR